jgi:hypothetical protein
MTRHRQDEGKEPVTHLEFVDGKWGPPGHLEPDALVVWCWWAQGRMGDAPTLEAAKAAAEAALRRPSP